MTQYPIDIYARWLRRFLAYLVPTRVRLLLPGALHPRQGRPARAAAHPRSSSSPLVALASRGRRRARLAVSAVRHYRSAGRMIEVDALRQAVRRARGRFRRERGVRSTRCDDISFRVERGELVGYLGPNGAGKSTTIKMLTGILVPTRGHVRVAGLEPSRQRIELARRIGACSASASSSGGTSRCIDSFELLRHIYRVPADRSPANLDALPRAARPRPVPRHAGAPALARPAHARRADARRCCTSPELLFLDEPTIGLDVVAKQRVRDFLDRDQPRATASPCC